MQASVVERLFSLKENGTSVSQEVSAGVTTFMAMSYLIFVIPSMLADGGIPRDAATSSVILVTVAVTLLMGLWARYPVGVAPGLGITAFFAYYVCGPAGFTWQAGLRCGVYFRHRLLPTHGDAHPPVHRERRADGPQARDRGRHRCLHCAHRYEERRSGHCRPEYLRGARQRDSARGSALRLLLLPHGCADGEGFQGRHAHRHSCDDGARRHSWRDRSFRRAPG